jgi:hypothetical protein
VAVTNETETTRSTRNSASAPDGCHEVLEPVLCVHCKRTAKNGIRCLGMCVADNDY